MNRFHVAAMAVLVCSLSACNGEGDRATVSAITPSEEPRYAPPADELELIRNVVVRFNPASTPVGVTR